MKFLRLIHIILITCLVLMISGLAQGWTRHRYDHWDRHRYRHHGYSPHYRDYHRPDYHHYRPRYQYTTIEDGWNLVKKGRSNTALEVFGRLAKSNPGAGQPKLGYAIAAADTGQLSQSVWSMRRALQFGPGAFQMFVPDLRLRGTLERQVIKFKGRSHKLPQKDAWFMQAAIYYLLKDSENCLNAIDKIKKAEDNSDSAKNLYYMAQNYL